MGYFRSKYDFLVQELVCNQAHHYNKCKYQIDFFGLENITIQN